MTPNFVKAALPMLAKVVTLCERAREGDAQVAQEVRGEFLAALEVAKAQMRGPRSEEWTVASYAITALMDELMIVDVAWEGREWWENHAVEVELFGTRRRATEFFDRVGTAASYPEPTILTVFVAVVVMGFRGILRDKPEALEAWLRSNGKLLRQGHIRPAVPTQDTGLEGAPPLRNATTLVWNFVATSMGAAIFIVTAWWAFVVS
jgi:type IV/VI secretion system ImpK/VasF family protein